MKSYTRDELATVIAEHQKWLEDKGGACADLSGADLRGANLRGANLSYTNLRGANLNCADLRGADLRGADLRGADLSGANLRGADLSGADLSGANLSGADLSRANLRGANLSCADLCGVKVFACAVFAGIYKYTAMPVIAEDGTEHIRLGCHVRTVQEWAKDFWNNPNEFPEGSLQGKDRWNAYQACLRWLEDHREVVEVPGISPRPIQRQAVDVAPLG